MLRSKLPREKTARRILLVGIGFIAVGLILNLFHPSVKKIWNSTFVLLSSGICLVLLALFYWIIDVKGHTKWGFPLKVIGINAITAYVLSHVIDFSAIANYILFGFEQFLGDYYGVLTTVGGFGILYLLLWYMNKNKTYIKI